MEWLALFDFVPTEGRHIGLSKGDRILEVQHQGNGWAYGHNANTGKFGAFPSNYVETNLNLMFEPQQHTFHDSTKKGHQYSLWSIDDDLKKETDKEETKINKTPNNPSNTEKSKPVKELREKLEVHFKPHSDNVKEIHFVEKPQTMEKLHEKPESHFKADSYNNKEEIKVVEKAKTLEKLREKLEVHFKVDNNIKEEINLAEKPKTMEKICEKLESNFKADGNNISSSETNIAADIRFNVSNKTSMSFDEPSDSQNRDVGKSKIINQQLWDNLKSTPLSLPKDNEGKTTTTDTRANFLPVANLETPKLKEVSYPDENNLPTKSLLEESKKWDKQNSTLSISTKNDEMKSTTKVLPLEVFKTPKSKEVVYADEHALPTNILTYESKSPSLKALTKTEPKSVVISSHVNKEFDNSNISASQIPMNTEREQIRTQTTQYKTQNRGNKRKRYRQRKPRFPKFSFNTKINLQASVAAGIIGGLLAGVILYVLLVFNFSYSYKDAGFVIIPYTIFSGLGLAFSTYVRCFMLLTIPSLFTGNGRAMFLTMIFGVLLSGPVVNILHNGNEMAKSIACTTDLIKSQSLLLAKKLGEPIQKVAERLREHFNTLKKMAGDIIDAIEPIKNALENVQEGFSAATDFLKGIYQKCESGAEDVLEKCKTGMGKAREKCEEFMEKIDPTKYVYRAAEKAINWGQGAARAVINFFGKRRRRSIGYLNTNTSLEANQLTIIDRKRYKRAVLDFICAPLQVDGVCNIFEIGKFICKPFDTVAQIASTATDKIFEALHEITNLFIFDIETEFDLSGGINSTKTSSQIVAQVSGELADKTELILFITKTFSKVMILSLLFVFVKSLLYIKNYNSKDYFDNIYITKEFKKFDLACKKAGKTTVLPLRRRELRKYVLTTSFSLSLIELKGSSQGIIVVVLHFMVTCLVMVFDYLIYYVLLLAKRYGQISVSVSGINVVKANVHGTGVIANFLRYLTSGLQIDNAFDVDFNITKCLPESSVPDIDYIFIFFVLYFIAFVLVCFQSYGMRLRRKITSYFYPEREFERILWLHEKIRHKRMTSISWLFQHLKSKKKEKDVSEKITLSSWFYYKFPKFSTMCGGCKPKETTCLCCEVTNDGLIKFHICQTQSCDAVYCESCFKEMKKCCYRCKIKRSGQRSRKKYDDIL